MIPHIVEFTDIGQSWSCYVCVPRNHYFPVSTFHSASCGGSFRHAIECLHVSPCVLPKYHVLPWSFSWGHSCIHVYRCQWFLMSGGQYKWSKLLRIPLHSPLDSWGSQLNGFGIVPQHSSKPVTEYRSILSWRLLAAVPVGGAMLHPMVGRWLNHSIVSLHNLVVTFAGSLSHSDIYRSIQLCRSDYLQYHSWSMAQQQALNAEHKVITYS